MDGLIFILEKSEKFFIFLIKEIKTWGFLTLFLAFLFFVNNDPMFTLTKYPVFEIGTLVFFFLFVFSYIVVGRYMYLLKKRKDKEFKSFNFDRFKLLNKKLNQLSYSHGIKNPAVPFLVFVSGTCACLVFTWSVVLNLILFISGLLLAMFLGGLLSHVFYRWSDHPQDHDWI
jgi:hypothetical protein